MAAGPRGDASARTVGLFGGAALAWPLAARAQQPAIPVIGFLRTRAAGDSAPLVAAFRKGLRGDVEEPNVAIEFRWAEGNYERLPALVADLLKQHAALLVTAGGEPSALMAKAATWTVPIVLLVGGDPVKLGLVRSYNRPEGNATGVSVLTSEIEAKRLRMLHDLVPNATVFGVLLNPKMPPFASQIQEVQDAARTIGLRIEPLYASTDAELEPLLAALTPQGVDGLLITSDPFFDTRRDTIIASAAQSRVSAIYQSRSYALAGGLISYGISFAEAYRQAGVYAGRILQGANPAELPVVQPTRFELVINLKTAKTLGLTVPQLLLGQAEEVIE
jgi:putative tryptophan/tyrosine transport system substrate-binding protein